MNEVSLTMLAQALVNGVLLGLVYTAMSIGLSLTMGILGIVNVAHSTFTLLGAYLAFELLNRSGVDPIVSMVVAGPVFFAIGALLQRGLVRRLAGAPETTGLLVLFGVLVAIEAIVILVWTTDTRALRTSYAGTSLPLGPVALSTTRLIAGALALTAVALLHLFLQRTLTGKGIRAMGQNRDAAMVLGIDVEWLALIVFGLGTALAAMGGVALAMIFSFAPPDHLRWLAWAFLVVVVAGLGSVRNTLLAGLAIGLVETLSGILLPFQNVYIVLYALLALALFFRTQASAGARTI